MSIESLSQTIQEKTSALYTAKLVDELGNAIPAAAILSLQLTYYDERTLQIINSRNAQNILNVNNVTLDALGILVWSLQPADTSILTVGVALESHVAMFVWTWSVPLKTGCHEVRMRIEAVQYAL